MTTKGVTDLWLPSKVAYHVKILLGGFFITVFLNVIWNGLPFAEGFWYMFIPMIVQLEIFMLIARRIFNHRTIKTERNYKGKIVSRLIAFYLIVFFVAAVFLFLIIAVNTFFDRGNFSDMVRFFISNELKSFLITLAIGIGLGSIAFFYFEWSHSLKREQKLREEKLVFQYETLKNQVNPHFLFNSLNTLSSLVSKDPELSEKFISRFSSIYRYILENRDKEFVNLSDEVAFINDYFFLQKIRDDGKIDLKIEIDDPADYRILPISLQLLVENALKHNAATKEAPLFIRIYLENTNVLVVENNLQKKMHMESSSKLGLKNLKERILLVMNRELLVEEGREKFIVKLPVIKATDEGTDHRR